MSGLFVELVVGVGVLAVLPVRSPTGIEKPASMGMNVTQPEVNYQSDGYTQSDEESPDLALFWFFVQRVN